MNICFAWAQLLLVGWLAALLDVSAQPPNPGWVEGPTTTLAPIDSFSIRVGTTASFSGRHVKESMEAYQGLILAKEMINSYGMFRTRSNTIITVDLTVYDDESKPSTTSLLFKHMLRSDDIGFFIGPFGSELSLVAARIIETASPPRILILHAAPDTSIYTQGLSWTFAVNPVVRDYFVNGLQILREQLGARTVFIAYSEGSENWNMCDGARYHARRLQYEVRGIEKCDITALTRVIRMAQVRSPDVFISCTDLGTAIDIAMRSRALMFNPKAMLTNHANSLRFVDAVGAKNANYMVGPQIWNRNNNEECRVFGNNSIFVDRYRQRWGENPTENSAHAAMALITIMLVTELVTQSSSQLAHILDDGPLVQRELISELRKEVVQQLHQARLQTFGASFRFSPRNGTRFWGAFPGTEQVVPDTSAETPAEQYMQSEFQMVTQDNPPRYPAPTWEQRELEIYPCPAGSIKAQWNGSACELCPAGKSRDQLHLVCLDCPAGSYSEGRGMVSCTPCKKGMACDHPSPALARLASPGFYRLGVADVEYRYYECHPPELCLGANQCSGDNIGLLCANCQPGYTTKGWNSLGTLQKLCQQCTGTGVNTLWFLGAICFYIMYISVVTVSDRASDNSLIAIHGVLLKIIINYGQFTSSVLEASEFEVLQNHPLLKDVSEFIMNPLFAFLIFDCSSSSTLRPEFLAVVFGWLIIPAGVFCSWAFFTLLSSVLICVHRPGNPLRRPQDRAVTATKMLGHIEPTPGVGRAPTLRRMASIDGEFDVVVDREDPDEVFEVEDEEDLGKSRLATVTTKRKAPWVLKPVHRHLSHRMDRHLETLWVRTAVISTYILYPLALRKIMTGMQCVKMDKYRLVSNLDMQCFEGPHIAWFVFSLVGAILFGLGIPALTFWKLHKVRKRLLDFDVKNMYGFLFNGFEPSCYKFEVFYMIRKFLIIVASVIPDLYARNLAMLWLCLTFLAVQLLFRPWDNRAYFIFDQLETVSLIAVSLLLTLRIIFEMRKGLVDSILGSWMMSEAFTMLGWISVIVWHALFWGLALGGLLRNVVVRHWQFRERLMPDSLSCFQRFLCSWFESKSHLLTIKPFSHMLNFEDIDHREKSLLYSVLCDTLEQYILLGKRKNRFCTEYMWGALQEAFRLHEPVYIRKVEKLRKHHNKYKIEGEVKEQNKMTMEEFQAALMVAWPGIAEGEDRFFQPIKAYEYEEVLNMAARKHDLIWQKNMPLFYMVEILERRAKMSAFHDGVQYQHDVLHKTPIADEFDVENVIPVDGMEEAHFDFGSAAFLPNVHEVDSCELLLQDYEAGLEEFFALEKESHQLRNLIFHRKYVHHNAAHVHHDVVQSAVSQIGLHVETVDWQADVEDVSRFDNITRFDREFDQRQFQLCMHSAELGQEAAPREADPAGERLAHHVHASTPDQQQEGVPGLSEPGQQASHCLPNSAGERRALDAEASIQHQQQLPNSAGERQALEAHASTPHQQQVQNSAGERRALEADASTPHQQQLDASAGERRALDSDASTPHQQHVDAPGTDSASAGRGNHLLEPAFKPKATHALSLAFIESGSVAGGLSRTLAAQSSTDV